MSERPASVLVVDDSADNRELLERRLAKQGYAVTVASGGELALELLAARGFDIVLLDVIMPGTSGLDVLRAIRADERLRGLPVIMTTALSDLDDVRQSLDLGADDYVVKPLEMPIVLGKMRQLLEARGGAKG
jgi:DNA-binding response OmpR family regulator